MSALDKSPGTIGTMYKVSPQYELDSTNPKQLGGVGASTVVPTGMNVLLGIYAHLSSPLLTDDEEVAAWGWLDTEDGFNIKPFEFLYPVIGCSGAGAGGRGGNSTPGIFYPINCPVVPGGRISAHAQGFLDHTLEPWVQVVYWFGKNLSLPKMLDDHPGRQRWRKVGHTATETLGTAWAPENQYQFTLSARGGALTEVGGVVWYATQDPTTGNGGATLQVNSADVPCMPMDFSLNACGTILGAGDPHDGSHTITKRPCSAFGEKVVHIDAQLAMSGASPLTGADGALFVSMVEFVRRGE